MACEQYYRMKHESDVKEIKQEQEAQQSYFKDDRELLAYLMEVERMYEPQSAPESRFVATGR